MGNQYYIKVIKKMGKLLSKIFGFVPMSRWKAAKLVRELQVVLEAIQVNDAQHSHIERSIIEQIAKLSEIMQKGTSPQAQSEDKKSHPEFG